jgi:hypothetical protein
MKMSEGKLLELIPTWKRLPKLVRIVQVKNDKVWLVDEPRTFPMPRYLKIAELRETYKEVI